MELEWKLSVQRQDEKSAMVVAGVEARLHVDCALLTGKTEMEKRAPGSLSGVLEEFERLAIMYVREVNT